MSCFPDNQTWTKRASAFFIPSLFLIIKRTNVLEHVILCLVIVLYLIQGQLSPASCKIWEMSCLNHLKATEQEAKHVQHLPLLHFLKNATSVVPKGNQMAGPKRWWHHIMSRMSIHEKRTQMEVEKKVKVEHSNYIYIYIYLYTVLLE